MEPLKMSYILHIPGERARALRWTVHDPRSSWGQGVLLYRNSSDILDGATFRALRDTQGARLETDNPARARSALRLMADEPLEPIHALRATMERG
jgi:hypothetical protein